MGREEREAHKETERGIKDKNPGRRERRMSEGVGSDSARTCGCPLSGDKDVPTDIREVTEEPLGEDNETTFIPLLTGLSKHLTRASGGRKDLFWLIGDGYSPSWHDNTISNGSRSLK